MLSEPLSLNPDIVLLDYACVIRKDKLYLWNNLVIQYLRVTSFFGHNAAAGPDQLPH